MSAREDMRRLVESIAKLDNPQHRKEAERRTNQRNRLSEHKAEQRHSREQARRLK